MAGVVFGDAPKDDGTDDKGDGQGPFEVSPLFLDDIDDHGHVNDHGFLLRGVVSILFHAFYEIKELLYLKMLMITAAAVTSELEIEAHCIAMLVLLRFSLDGTKISDPGSTFVLLHSLATCPLGYTM